MTTNVSQKSINQWLSSVKYKVKKTTDLYTCNSTQYSRNPRWSPNSINSFWCSRFGARSYTLLILPVFRFRLISSHNHCFSANLVRVKIWHFGFSFHVRNVIFWLICFLLILIKKVFLSSKEVHFSNSFYMMNHIKYTQVQSKKEIVHV